MIEYQDAPEATLLVVTENMQAEVRQTFYVRRAGEPVDGFLPAYGVATIQGRPWRS